MTPGFAELHCLSNHSFLRGASHPEELVEAACNLGYSALALSDECSLAGVVKAHLEARRRGLKLIVGSEFRLPAGARPARAVNVGGDGERARPEPGRLVLLATNREGYAQLSGLITAARRDAEKGQYRLDLAMLQGRPLDRCLAIWVSAAEAGSRQGSEPVPCELESLLPELFPGRLWIGVGLFLDGRDGERLAALRSLGARVGAPLVACNDVHMHSPERRRLQDTLTAIRLNRPLAELGRELFPNGERHLRPLSRLARLYPPELLEETLCIAERCHFSLDELRYEYPAELVPAGQTPTTWLRELTETGIRARWPEGAPEAVRRQVEHELALIAELRYEPFFLTIDDIVRFARGRGILCQGRGSAANSAVCYCLGITEVDPARMNLLFERFISRERNEPPDIDVDFEHERREEVIQYIYRKYGRQRAALAASVNAYRGRSAVRDVAKALGFGPDQVEALSGMAHPFLGDSPDGERIRAAGFDPDNPKLRLLTELAREIRGFPRHLSQHSGGFVIAADDLSRLVPVENARMPERTVIQWDKDDLEALGLLKVDILALGMLTAIRKALDLVSAWSGVPLSLDRIPPEDPEVYRMLQAADSVGVFQVESRAQMAMLPRLRPACYYDLVIEVAIVRPGPIQGDMVHPYLARRSGREPVTYPGPAVEKVLKRTLGVPIFQEQVMQLAMVAASFTAGEADQLRRAMAAWRKRGGLEKFEARLIDGMRERGYSEEFARQIYRQIRGFGEYGFPESHSASFALLVYVSAWLKRYHPAAFAAALINSQPMGFYPPAQLVADARRHGVEVRPIDVRFSDWNCGLELPAAGPGSVDKRSASTERDPPDSLSPSGLPACTPLAKGGPGAIGRNGLEASPASSSDALRLSDLPVYSTRTNPEGCAPDAPAGLDAGKPPPGQEGSKPALRLGLRLVKGLSRAGADALLAARAAAPFRDAADLLARAGLDRRDAEALAAADALRGLSGHRHRAFWDMSAREPATALFGRPDFAEAEPLLPIPGEGQDILADYRSAGLSLRRHPLALLRPRLAEHGLLTAAEVRAAGDAAVVRTAGLVICRQRPMTASGVVFLTLEDETGQFNLIVWPSLALKYRLPILQARLLAVFGEVQEEDGVLHVITARLHDLSGWLGDLSVPCRDFG